MSGHLQISPFAKSYEEMTRAKDRMEQYSEQYQEFISSEIQERIDGMIASLDNVINHIPTEYQTKRLKRRHLHLQDNPFLKTFDELTRTKKRMHSYLAINHHLLSSELKNSVEGMMENVQQAINYIPEEFQIERYKRKA